MSLISTFRLVVALCANVWLAGATLASADDERSHRLRCGAGANGSGSFVIPPAYRSVTEPGGYVVISKDGTPWHPDPADVRRFGVHIYEGSDDIRVRSLAQLHAKPVAGGTVYSRIECSAMVCRYEARFVPTNQETVAQDCGVSLPGLLRIEGQSESAMTAASSSIIFRWGEGDRELSLADLEVLP